VDEMEVAGKGRQRKVTVKRDLEIFGVNENVAFYQRRWRQIIASPTPT